MVPRAIPVGQVERETHDTFTLGLDFTDFRFAPGQFNMLYAFGVGEAPISISGDPADRRHIRHTIRMVGDVTRNLCSLKPGELLGVRGPFGAAWPLPQAPDQDIVLVAGGIGLAPIRPVIYQLLRRRSHFRRVTLLYGARSPQDILFKAELDAWRQGEDLDVLVTVDQSDVEWNGRVGVVTALFDRIDVRPSQTSVMICGPEIMMRFATRNLERLGIPSARIFVSMERNMKCAVGLCGHCQYGPDFLCREGPILPFSRIENRLLVPEV